MLHGRQKTSRVAVRRDTDLTLRHFPVEGEGGGERERGGGGGGGREKGRERKRERGRERGEGGGREGERETVNIICMIANISCQNA